MEEIPQVTLKELIGRYSVILFDAYGVLAGSNFVVPEAPEAIDHLNEIGKPYFILTNDASALPETRAGKYAHMGLGADSSKIITSGSLLTRYFQDAGLSGSRCVVLGPEDSHTYVRDAGGEVVSYHEDFDVMVIGDQAGFPFLEAADAVLSSLFRKIDAGDPAKLVLPNPDLIYPDGDGFGFASGTIAQMFESALELRYPDRPEFRFTRLGKPYPAIFTEALRRSSTMDMVMIGDTPETDIKGANDFGIASALVGTGISTVDLAELREDERPTYRMKSLAL